MSSLIVVEGVDGAGKTTLVKALARRLGMKALDPFERHGSWMKMAKASRLEGINDYAEDFALTDAIATLGAEVVCDRGVVSAHVYRKFEGRDVWERFHTKFYWRSIAPERTAYIWLRRNLDLCRLSRFSIEDLMLLDSLFESEYEQHPYCESGKERWKMIVENKEFKLEETVECVAEKVEQLWER